MKRIMKSHNHNTIASLSKLLVNKCLLSLLVIFVANSVQAIPQSELKCSLSSSWLELSVPHQNITYVNEDANVFFTILLPNLSCNTGNAERRDSLIYLNAVKYALHLLNNASSIQNDNNDFTSSIAHFFPSLKNLPNWSTHVKYGAKIVNIQSHQEDSNNLSFLNCTNDNIQGSLVQLNDLAVLDGAQFFSRNSNSEILEQIPIISLSSSNSILATSYKANLIIQLIDVLEWRHFGIITTKHEDSLYIVKLLGQIAHAGHVCIGDIFEWSMQDFSEPTLNITNSEPFNGANQHFNDRLSSFMKSIYFPQKKIPILVISNDEKQVSKLADILYTKYENQISSHQLFFSLVPSPELLSKLQLLSKWSTVFTLTSQLPDLPGFAAEDIKHKECKNLDENQSLQNTESWLKWRSFLPIRSLMLVTMGFNMAIDDLCHSTQKSPDVPWCKEISNLKRQSFLKYLDELESKLESAHIKPKMYLGTVNNDGQVNDLLLYIGDEFRVLKTNYSFEPSKCSEDECKSCIKFRQSRNDEDQYDNNMLSTNSDRMLGHGNHHDLHILLNGRESSVPDEEDVNDVSMIHVETYEVNLGLILPLHQSGASILECSSDLNLPAYYIYEAAQWIINKINQNNYLIPGIEIKLELIDTCSSPFYATQELVHLTSSDSKVQPIAFVSSVPRDHYKQIVDFVSSINYTLLATQDISFMDLKFGPKHGILQTAVTSLSLLKVLIEQLKYFGWRYVSVVVDFDDMASSTMFHHLSELAMAHKVCFASVEQVSKGNMNQTINNLLDNYRNGANVVILLTNFVATVNLMSYYQSIVKSEKVKNENLHFILLRDQNLNLVHGFEEEFMGSIFIKESIGSIAHFDNHFLERLANPKKDPLLYKFIQQCGSNSAQCLRTIGSFDQTITTNTMQAILAIVGGFARMRNETCVNQKGICSEMLDSQFHQKLLKYILNTRSMRIDSESDRRFKSENFDVFEFNSDGSSSRDIEILNFKHDFSNGLFRFDTVALYVHKLETILKNPNIRYVFYKYNGIVNQHKEYNETEFITSDCLNLKQCGQCEPQTPEFVFMPSWNDLILTGVFDVHSHLPQNPLICDKNRTIFESVENVEAFLWTIEMINNDPNILPGVHLGALVFDSCSSYQKVYRDISNFLSDSLLLGDYKIQIPTAESVVGFVVDGKNTKILDSILDLTNPLKMTVIASESHEIKYNNIKSYPQFLGLSLPNSFYIDAILNLLKKNSWTFISILYENNNFMNHRFIDAFSHFQANSQQFGVKVAAKEMFDENNIYDNIQNLNSAKKIGAKVIVLFLSGENLKKFLLFNSLIEDDNSKLLSHEVIYIVIDSQETFMDFSNQRLNVISISEYRTVVPEFEEHFLDLSLHTNVKNPWFAKLWEKVYDCKGFGCYRNTESLRSKNITISTETTNVINSVFSLVHGMEIIRQQLCPNTYKGLCPNFHKQIRQLSRLEHQFIKQNPVDGLDSKPISFNPESNYATGYVQISNFQFDISDLTFKWFPLGTFDAEKGLVIDISKSKFYQINGTISKFNKVVSTCQDVSQCDKTLKNSELPLLMLPTEDAQATIALILPLHKSLKNKNNDNITCGEINPDSFENLMAFHYALDRVNRNSTVQLNTLILDSCAHNKQSLQRLATIQNYKTLSKIVSIISLTDGNQSLSNELWNMLNDYNPFVYNLYRRKFGNQQNFFFNQNMNYNPNDNQMFILQSIVDYCSRNNWLTVNLVYVNEFNKNYFIFEANKNNICVDKTFKVSSNQLTKSKLVGEWNEFTTNLDTHVIVFLADSNNIEFLIKSTRNQYLNKFILVGDENLKTGSSNYRKAIANVAVIKRRSTENSIDHKALTSAMDNLSKYFELNNQNFKTGMLDKWLKQYWRKKFNCFDSVQKRNDKCFASSYVRKSLINVKETKRLIDFIGVLGNVVTKFVQVKCKNTTGGQIDDLCLYNYHLRNELKNSIVDNLSNNNYFDDLKKANTDGSYEIQLLSNYGKTLNVYNSINWIEAPKMIPGLVTNIQTACNSSCDSCRTQLSQSKSKSISMFFADSIQSPLISTSNVHRTWGIVASIISTLGLIMVLICVLYFILVFPVALGTTIIGYQILIGLFICYLINFAYLLPNTHLFCLIKKFGLPFAYCIIFSGFFVKVYNYWCQLLMKKTTKTLKYSSPLAQLSISLVFIVLQLVNTFLSMYHSGQNFMSNQNNCTFENSHFDSFHIKFFLPIVLLVALFISVMFFAIKTFDNLDSRWISVCSVLSALTWISWFAYNWLYPKNINISIVSANLFNTTIIIVLLYMRKLYLFSKISRKILKDRRLNMEGIRCEPFNDNYQQYGAFKACSENISWSNIQDRINYRNATRSPFEGDQEDNVSSCGSVKSNTSSQVQCQELYPMDVYDNQMSQVNTKVGQSTRSIYDMMGDENMK